MLVTGRRAKRAEMAALEKAVKTGGAGLLWLAE